MPGPTPWSILCSQFYRLPYPETDFTGQTVIVTGGNTGIGMEAAKHFVRLHAARVIISSRSPSKGQSAKDAIETSTKVTGVVEVWELDLTNSDSVKSFAERAERELQKIDCVVENAGIMTQTFTTVEPHDLELELTVNVLNTFYLALLLLPKLRASAAPDSSLRRPHLVIVTSEAHVFSNFKNWDSPDILVASTQQAKRSMALQYQTSKLMGLLLASELAAHVSPDEVIINAVNPGLCVSELGRDLPFVIWALQAIARMTLARSSEVGSRTYMYAATLGRESHGAYVSDCIVNEPSGFVTSDEGLSARRSLWAQVLAKLEKKYPGVSSTLTARNVPI